MHSNVCSLELREVENVRPEAIDVLKGSLGQVPSKDVVARAVYEISDRLGRMEFALKHAKLDVVSKIASSLVSVCAQIGLYTLSKVAQDVVECLRRMDYVAIAATFKRLMRLSESALFSAVNYADA